MGLVRKKKNFAVSIPSDSNDDDGPNEKSNHDTMKRFCSANFIKYHVGKEKEFPTGVKQINYLGSITR